MDYYKFVESKDIRDYLEKINYKFTTPEAAYLIWASRSAFQDEKFEAFEFLINSWPNCSMEDRVNAEAIPDFHAFLRKYIDLKKKQVRVFKEPAGEVYQYVLSGRDENAGMFPKYSGPFISFSGCMDAAFCDIKENYSDCDKITVRKYKINRIYGVHSGELFMDRNGRIRDIVLPDQPYGDVEIDDAFKGMWFDFPTPFKSGDILRDVDDKDEDHPFVLNYINTWKTEKMKEVRLPDFDQNADERAEKYKKDGDLSLMCASGYSMGEDVRTHSTFLEEVSFIDGRNYLRQEYCRKPLQGKNQALIPISKFLKKEINLGKMVNGYEMYLNKIRKEEIEGCLLGHYGTLM